MAFQTSLSTPAHLESGFRFIRFIREYFYSYQRAAFQSGSKSVSKEYRLDNLRKKPALHLLEEEKAGSLQSYRRGFPLNVLDAEGRSTSVMQYHVELLEITAHQNEYTHRHGDRCFT